ncbi:MAG: NTP transferase domain-containing protein, partial [Gammaproteobacteria bacterium]|nr:NTP transferase domain-containing protein [Gammaproteobacteria bacterium]NNJ72516.1 NTP transferase domain-containing protein [Enterobacterales bacterium]
KDKATQKLGEFTLLDIVTSNLLDAGCHEVKVSSNRLPNAVKDDYANYGPVAGIHATVRAYLEENKVGQLLVVPVDMPILSAKTLQRLVTSKTQVNLSRFKDYQLPLCLELAATTLETLTELLEQTTVDKGISLKRMFRDFNEHIITVGSELDLEQEFVNCNSKIDLDALRANYNK